MNELKDLWMRRASSFWGNAVFYLRTIITGYMYIPIILMILLAFLYRYVLSEWKESGGLVTLLLALLLTWFLSRSQTRTFLKEADLVYILPLESKLHQYFRFSLAYSFIVQSFVLFLFMLLISPLYNGIIERREESFYPLVLALIALKGWNLLSQWQEQRWRESWMRGYHVILRWGVNFWVSAAFFALVEIFPFTLGAFFLFLTWSYYRAAQKNGYDLIWLVHNEKRMKARFYAFVQWFMDVPQMGYQVRKREWGVFFFRWIPFQPQRSYSFLFSRSFIRYTDLFQLYWRVCLAGMLLVFFIENRYLTFFIFFALLIMNGIQLSSAWHRLHATFWSALYPISPNWKERGFLEILFLFLMIQAALMAVTHWVRQGFMDSIILLILGILFSYIFSFHLISRRWRAKKG